MNIQRTLFLVLGCSLFFFSCQKEQGCTDLTSCNYSNTAEEDDGSCFYPGNECDDNNSATINDIVTASCECVGSVASSGCTDNSACNYNPGATEDDGSCEYPGDPCNDFNSNTVDDQYNSNCICVGTIIESGCLDASACNYNPDANSNDPFSCIFPGDPCDDGDPNTTDDEYNSNCDCEGTPPTLDECEHDIDGFADVTFGLYADSWEEECQYRIYATNNESITTDWMVPTMENTTNESGVGLSVGDWTMQVEDSYGDGKGPSGYYYATCLSPTGAVITLVHTPFTDGYSSSTDFTLGTGFTDQSVDDNN